SAATLGLDELAELAHRMEDRLLPLRGSEQPLPQPLADALLESLDAWMAQLRATAAKSEPPDRKPVQELLAQEPAAAKPEARPAEIEEPQTAEETSWRVSTRQVIELLHEVERLREVRLRIDERRRELDRAAQHLGSAADARVALTNLRRALGADGEEAADIVSAMEEGLKAISTMPVRTVIEPLRRAGRDLCKATGKMARLSVVGAEVSLDRRVLEHLRGPLVHLVRNAVDHGLEMPQARERAGKHREGALTIRVEQQGNMLFIEVADDGAGLDLARIREAAVRRGAVPAEELAKMTDAQVQQLVFRSGFTPRTDVTDVSGRGVGLDVVRDEVDALHGQVEVQSTPGQGTRFILSLPAELGSSPVLVVRCGEHQLGVPMAAIESSRLARAKELRVGRARVQLDYHEQLLSLQDLGALVGLRQPEAPGEGQPVLIVM